MLERLSSSISVTALASTIIAFVVANGISYLAMQSRLHSMADGYAECGFPFSLYGCGGFVGVSQFLWPGLVADYLIAMSVSVAVGVMWQKFKA